MTKIMLDVRSFTFTGLFVLGIFYSLYFARGFFFPVILAALLSFLLAPIVHSLHALRVPRPLAAALVVASVLALLAVAIYVLWGPATRWIAETPERLARIERELTMVLRPMESVSEAAQRVEAITQGDGEGELRPTPVRVQGTSVVQVLLGQTKGVVAGALFMFVLLYFLLASGDLFLRKLVRTMRTFSDRKRAVRASREIQRDISTYLLTYAVINSVLGLAIGVAMRLLGVPNPLLWGVMAGLLNFIPYLGAAIGMIVVTLVALPVYESLGGVLIVPFAYLVLTALEGNIITPTIMGRRLTLNPVVVFLGVTFWFWLWGIPGAILATPLLVTFKVICDHYEPLEPVGEFLGR